MQKLQWVFKDLPKENDIQSLSNAINVNNQLASILLQRGISNFEEAKNFFRPSLDSLHDPFLMKDMDVAVNRINEAIGQNQRILVYGDYDVDGTSSVATFYGFLSRYYTNCEYYIPDRYKEGYGISKVGIDYAAQENISLVISIDCGIKAIHKIAYAKEKGIDFIVCDHHRPGEALPEAVAVLDPKRNDCEYPFDELCGCGVGFKLLQAWCIQNTIEIEELFEYLDLVAIATASDIVPLLGENRVLTAKGIEQINTKPSTGVKALINVAGLGEKKLTVSDVVFGIGPRINAAGRLEHARYAAEVLLEEDYEVAYNKALSVNQNNSRRKNLDQEITLQAVEMIKENPQWSEANSTVLFHESWHKGVIGIVASRCIESFYRPTIIFTESNGKATGSARSVLGFDVYEAISSCSDLIDQYGGHMYAAGLTIEIDKIDEFRKRFEEAVSSKITPEQLIPKQVIDLPLSFSDITDKFFHILEQMGPFGPGNMQPVFMSDHLQETGKSKIVGDNHLKLEVIQDGVIMSGIAFKQGEKLDLIKSGQPFALCYTIDENEFRGKKSLQLMVKDIKSQTN